MAKAMVYMKNAQNEKLSEHLLNVDEEILDNAYEIDDAEKLKEYVKTKNRERRPFYLTPVFRRGVTVAACFLLIAGMVLSLPAISSLIKNSVLGEQGPYEESGSSLTEGTGDPDKETLPPWQRNDGYLNINSIDMLNYFSAVRVLEDPAELSATGAKGGVPLGRLSVSKNITAALGFLLKENEGVDGEEFDPSTDRPSFDYQPPSDVIYYELERNAVFTLSKVIFFQIELKDESGFLALKVGTGIVDVVITENDLENMITFRNGDRYYSCCEGGWSSGVRDFSTHKYVENFCIVKNLEQDNYLFSIYQDELGNVTGMVCEPYKNGGPDADTDISVASETYTADVRTSFTIADLEEYFNTGKFPESGQDPSEEETPSMITPPEDAVIVDYYVGDTFIFDLMSNQTFVYYSTDKNIDVYRKGNFYVTANTIILEFKVEGEIVERVTCDLSEQNGSVYFVYDGIEYIRFPREDSGDQPTDPPAVYSDLYFSDMFIFELQSDRTFAFRSRDESQGVYRKGEYAVIANTGSVKFWFMEEGQIVEIVNCDMLQVNGFTYDGVDYIGVLSIVGVR